MDIKRLNFKDITEYVKSFGIDMNTSFDSKGHYKLNKDVNRDMYDDLNEKFKI